MPILPAFCDTCGTVFDSGYSVENSIGATLAGNQAGPCPKCGNNGHVPDGVFDFIGNTIQILSAPERTIAELGRLAELLQEAKAKAETREQVVSRIEKELPFLSSIVKLLPTNKVELYAFLSLVVMVAQFAVQNMSSPSISHSTTIEVNQVIQQRIVEDSRMSPSGAKPDKKVGRNEQCPCGSGKKYKKCCGKLK